MQANALSSADGEAGRLRRTVRPDGEKGAPNLEDGRNPRNSAAPRKRRCAAKMIAYGACCERTGGKKGLEKARCLQAKTARAHKTPAATA